MYYKWSLSFCFDNRDWFTIIMWIKSVQYTWRIKSPFTLRIDDMHVELNDDGYTGKVEETFDYDKYIETQKKYVALGVPIRKKMNDEHDITEESE